MTKRQDLLRLLETNKAPAAAILRKKAEKGDRFHFRAQSSTAKMMGKKKQSMYKQAHEKLFNHSYDSLEDINKGIEALDYLINKREGKDKSSLAKKLSHTLGVTKAEFKTMVAEAQQEILNVQAPQNLKTYDSDKKSTTASAYSDDDEVYKGASGDLFKKESTDDKPIIEENAASPMTPDSQEEDNFIFERTESTESTETKDTKMESPISDESDQIEDHNPSDMGIKPP